MDKVYEKLIAFKKRMNSDLVVIKDNKVEKYIMTQPETKVVRELIRQ